MHENAIAFGLSVEMEIPANDRSRLFARVKLIPSAYSICSWATHTWCFTAKSTRIPFGLVVSYQSKFGREYPPLTSKRQITALHSSKRDVFPTVDFVDMLVESLA